MGNVVSVPKWKIVNASSLKSKSYVGLKDYEDFAYDLNDPFTYSHPPYLLGEHNG